jgi:hypothetical protein
MLLRSPSPLLRRVLIGGAAGAILGFAIGFSLAAANPVPLLLALAGMAIGATLAQGAPEPAPVKATRADLAALEPPADPAPAWLPDPMGGSGERLWDGSGWTRHVWRRTR